MDEPTPEIDETWTDDGVRFVLQQPEKIRGNRANVWLIGLLAMALLSVPVALGMLFVPALAPFMGVSMIFVAAVFGWAFLPPFVVALLNRPLPVFVGQGRLEVGTEVFERGSIRSVGLVDGHLEVERRDGSAFRSGPVEPVDADRVMRLLDCVEVSDDQADAEQASKRSALRALQPLQERAKP